jgi:hypothetical protein
VRDAVVFVRTLPIGGDLRDKDLRVLVQRYIDEVSGAGYEAVQLNGQTVVAEQRFAAELRERGNAKLAGQDAYQATFDVANVDQLKVSPNARRTRVRIVFARTPFEHVLPRTPGMIAGVKYPVLMVAGYATMPEDFDKDLPAFTNLLGRIQFGQTLGYTPSPPELLPGATPVSATPTPTSGSPASVAAPATPAAVGSVSPPPAP